MVKIIANNGRYGPYLKFGNKFISIPAGNCQMKLTLKSQSLWLAKLEADQYMFMRALMFKGEGIWSIHKME